MVVTKKPNIPEGTPLFNPMFLNQHPKKSDETYYHSYTWIFCIYFEMSSPYTLIIGQLYNDWFPIPPIPPGTDAKKVWQFAWKQNHQTITLYFWSAFELTEYESG